MVFSTVLSSKTQDKFNLQDHPHSTEEQLEDPAHLCFCKKNNSYLQDM